MIRRIMIFGFIMLYSFNSVVMAHNLFNKGTYSSYINVAQFIDIYANDLTNIESFIFGKTYKKDTLEGRLCRVENKLYGKTLTGLSIASRMNNIITDYKRDYYQANNNKTYCAPEKGVLQKLKDAFIGVPVGYTPQIEPSPYINTYGPSYMQGFYGSNGWRDHNVYSPSYAASRLHILD